MRTMILSSFINHKMNEKANFFFLGKNGKKGLKKRLKQGVSRIMQDERKSLNSLSAVLHPVLDTPPFMSKLYL
ncbi:hypothetical protein [Massiliimalia timonensis]|uniref:hypothetical protein n=1 Tax=Massiliimalia timonensis TaxID=1987501 RepID=UPI0018A06C69|nr:hypothetical protein [Massiliimalia timonensis]